MLDTFQEFCSTHYVLYAINCESCENSQDMSIHRNSLCYLFGILLSVDIMLWHTPTFLTVIVMGAFFNKSQITWPFYHSDFLPGEWQCFDKR